ncbi:MAG: PASTA domain-containing protein [Oscillospiraceae bacterium]|nr:PASTA domain-containing protein [Oscillospiraceae bacterium]
MRADEMLDCLEFLDSDLIEAAAQPPTARKKSPFGWQLRTIAATIAILFSVDLIAFVFKSRPSDVHLDHPSQPTFVTQPTEVPVPSNPVVSEPVEQTGEVIYLMLDINPSFRFAVKDGTVLECEAGNQDAERILDQLELVDQPMESAVSLVMQALINEGYMNVEDSAPILLLSATENEASAQLLHEVLLTVNDCVLQNEKNCFVVTQQITDAEAAEQLAQQYNTSLGKMQYVLKLLREETGLSEEEASALTLIELFDIDIEKRLIEPPYKVDDIDECGERALYVGTTDSYISYVSWQKIPPEEQQLLQEMYPPEALEIMFGPQVWSTVPNVVGLSVQEAVALFYSQNLAPRLCYADNKDVRITEGYTDGTCYYQDISPGRLWNSQASIQIYILLTEPE